MASFVQQVMMVPLLLQSQNEIINIVRGEHKSACKQQVSWCLSLIRNEQMHDAFKWIIYGFMLRSVMIGLGLFSFRTHFQHNQN